MPRRRPSLDTLARFTRYDELPLLVVLGLLFIAFTAWQPLFLQSANVTNMLRQAAVLAILALGQLFVVMTGGIDISVGAQVSMMSILGVQLANELPLAVAIALTVGIGAVIGAVNGAVVVWLKVSPIIATLGMWQLLSGLALWYTAGLPVQATSSSFLAIGASRVGPITTPTWIAIGVAAAAWTLLNRTPLGRHTVATGSNESAARLSGVNTGRVVWISYVLAGVASAVAAIVLSSRVSSGLPDLGSGLEILAIAAVFIGGVAWGGGIGRVSGVVLGVLLITALSNGFDLAAVSTDLQTIVTGVLIVAAVSLNAFRKSRLGNG